MVCNASFVVKPSFNFYLLFVATIIKFESVNGKQFNLRLNSTTQIITKDTQYYYIDNYFSKCLDVITNCTNGIGLAVNVTLGEFSENNKIVLLSSGGDSSYNVGGFYLHQCNINGDKYLEYGVSNGTLLYAIKVITLSFLIIFIKNFHISYFSRFMLLNTMP